MFVVNTCSLLVNNTYNHSTPALQTPSTMDFYLYSILTHILRIINIKCALQKRKEENGDNNTKKLKKWKFRRSIQQNTGSF